MLVNPKIAWMFENCYPNTLDTTVHFDEGGNAGRGDTFIYTGDIPAMWLRDSGAQVWPYVRYAAVDPNMRKMIAGTIIRQFKLICMDPYANAFNDGPTGEGHTDDKTGERPNKNVFERKWEIDSHCYPIRLAYAYWKTTGDTSVFDEEWLDAIELTLKVFKDQQRKKGHGDYFFLRETDRQFDTKCCVGKGNPVKPCGLIASSFRPSDDATTFEFLVPANFFAVKSLRQAAEILETVNHQGRLARECTSLADEVEKALKKYAVVKHPKYGKIYAYEVDGFGNALMMDDANIPSLLSLPYLEAVDIKDPVYKKTRKFILSEYNPYFHKGKVAEGVGSPHIDHDMIWPMSIMMRAFTAQSDKEIKKCVEMLMNTDANTGFMHESFHKDNADDFTREWFAWQNSLFGELIVHLIDNGKLEVLNSIKAPKYKDPYKRR
jgi:meiotically up-regulated gene 157 (Mug157) protein